MREADPLATAISRVPSWFVQGVVRNRSTYDAVRKHRKPHHRPIVQGALCAHDAAHRKR